jgi:hypothetical protein
VGSPQNPPHRLRWVFLALTQERGYGRIGGSGGIWQQGGLAAQTKMSSSGARHGRSSSGPGVSADLAQTRTSPEKAHSPLSGPQRSGRLTATLN